VDRLTAVLLRNQQRLAAVSNVTTGLLIWQERTLEANLKKKLTDWTLSRYYDLIRSGVINILQRQAKLLRRVPGTQKDKKKFIDDELKEILPNFYDQDNTDAERGYRYQLHVGHMRMWEYGGITALAQMGFNATARRVTDMEKKVQVRKAAGDVRFELTDDELIQAIDDRVIFVTARTSAAVIENVRRLIRDFIILGGLGTQEVADMIRSGQGFPSWYANRIARTEMHQAYEVAQHESFIRSGVKMHEWITVGDRRVRPEHVDNEAHGPVPVGQPFPSGQLHPGDGPGSVNCRCTIQPDLSDPSMLLVPWSGGQNTGFALHVAI